MARCEILGRSHSQTRSGPGHPHPSMSSDSQSLENLIHASSRALVIGVGGGGDVVGALATARFLEFCGLGFILGGLSWERSVYDCGPGTRAQREGVIARG